MKYASDFRSIARDSLRGRWAVAVIAGLIAAVLGGVESSGPELTFNFGDTGFYVNLEYADQVIYSTVDGFGSGLLTMWLENRGLILVAAVVMAVLLFALGSIIEVGYAKFNLDLVDRQKEPEIGTVFGFFSNWKTVAVAKLLQTLYVFLWSLLFIIPGIVASFSYAMTGFILAEDPELTASEAIERSKEMMYGNRWRLFCLQFSFIGWSILCSLTFGVGNLWLTPYRQAATAAFYREVSNTWHTSVFEQSSLNEEYGSIQEEH